MLTASQAFLQGKREKGNFSVEFRAKSRPHRKQVRTPQAGQTSDFYSPASQAIDDYFPE